MTLRLTTLPNGFRIVTEHMPGLKSASAGVWVMAGGRHERAEQNGIAHFLEHMAFKGTKRRTSLQIAEEIEDVGGYINAYTSREMTAYYARVLQNDVALALDVIGDIVLNPAFDKKEIEVERHVILQEIGQALDTPDDIIFDWLQEASYPDQSFGRTILGPEERVSSFTRKDLQGFVSEHYGPGQMILAAAGGTASGAFADKNVGTAKAITVTGHTLSGADAGNYNLVQQTGLTANITKADLSVTGITASNRVYDTTVTAVLGGTAAVSPLGSDVVTVGGTAAGTFADKNVGSAKPMLISGVALSGADAANYSVSPTASTTASITRLTATGS